MIREMRKPPGANRRPSWEPIEAAKLDTPMASPEPRPAPLTGADAARQSDPRLDTLEGETAIQRTSYEAGDAFLLQLNGGWRLAHDGRLQWILQRRASKPDKLPKWTGRRFHVERDALLRSVRELCGPVDPAAMATVAAWPRFKRSGPGRP